MTKKIETLAGVFEEQVPLPKKPENDPPQKLGGEVWYQ